MTTLATNYPNGVQVLASKPYENDAASGPGIVNCDQVKSGPITGDSLNITGNAVIGGSVTAGSITVTDPVWGYKTVTTFTAQDIIAVTSRTDNTYNLFILPILTAGKFYNVRKLMFYYDKGTSAFGVNDSDGAIQVGYCTNTQETSLDLAIGEPCILEGFIDQGSDRISYVDVQNLYSMNSGDRTLTAISNAFPQTNRGLAITAIQAINFVSNGIGSTLKAAVWYDILNANLA